MGAWMHGCMDAWMHVCMGVWMHGCMDACMNDHVCMYKSMNQGRNILLHWQMLGYDC